MQLQLPKLNHVTLHYFENCVGCGACIPSCPYSYVDEHYAPVEKAERLRAVLRSKYTFAGFVLKGVAGAKVPKSEEEMWELMDVAYRCANCGHCYATCPFGIDSGEMVNMLRGVITKAGFAPTLLKTLAELEEGGTSAEAWQKFLQEVSKLGVQPGRRGAATLLGVSLVDVLVGGGTVINAVRLLKELGEDVTVPERPLGIRPPIASTIGDKSGARSVLEKIVKYIEELGVKKVVLLDGGYPYQYLRFEATNLLGRKVGFQVVHIVELLSEYVKNGKLKLGTAKEGFTWHDPCHLARRGGVIHEPREVLKQAGLVELKHRGEEAMCLGGGAGVAMLHGEYRKLLQRLASANITEREAKFLTKLEGDFEKAIKHRMDEIKQAGVKTVVVGCWDCAYSIKLGSRLYGVGVDVKHIVDFVWELKS